MILWVGCFYFFPTNIHNSHAEHMPDLYQINNSQDICQAGSKSSCSWPCFWHREIAKSILKVFWCIMRISAYEKKMLLHLKTPSWTCRIGVRKWQFFILEIQWLRCQHILSSRPAEKCEKKEVGWKFWHTWITSVAFRVTQSIHKVTRSSCNCIY